MYTVDLNGDIGESFGNYIIGMDDLLLEHVSSVNIACGFHAGDPVIINRTVKKALELNVRIGAHPGFPDLMGFGRRNMGISTEEAQSYIIYQIGALDGFLKYHGGKLNHVKLHGALYNMAATDYKLSRAIAEAIYKYDKNLIFVGLSNSQMIKAGKDIGLQTASEIFADRAYNQDGTLVSRKEKNSMIEDINICIPRMIRAIKENKIESIEGNPIDIEADTICLHGDNHKSLEFAKALKKELELNNIQIKATK